MAGDGGYYVGSGRRGPLRAGEGRAVLVLGPPRSGKTTGLVVPNVAAASGAVVATSTKPDVLEATVEGRRRQGACWLFDPTGTTSAPPGVELLRWSPVAAAKVWDEALLVTRAMARAARPGGGVGDSGHWLERAEALLAPLMHAAALVGGDMSDVNRWVLRQDEVEAAAALRSRATSPVPGEVIAGIAATDARERSGIWSTAAGVVAAYRSDSALAAGRAPNHDPALLAGTSDTIYVCAPGDRQGLVAPVVVALIERARAGAYGASADGRAGSGVAFVLDEVANIAPLPDLPSLVSEGGGQGATTMACLQDLSQARHRWGGRADGFASLFGTVVVLPGIGDQATLELVSKLGGDIDVAVRTTTRGPWWSRDWGTPTTSTSTRRQRAIPFERVSQLPAGTALVVRGAEPPVLVQLPRRRIGKTVGAPGVGLG